MQGVTRRFRASRQRDDGAAAVEFAIVSTLLLTILFGILQYGLLFFQILTAQHAAAEAAAMVRTASVRDSNGNGNTCDEWKDLVAGSANLPEAVWDQMTWRPVDQENPGSLQIDDRIEISVVWEPVNIAGGLIPIPGDTPRETTVTTGLTRLGAAGEYASPFGCPLL